MIRKQSLLYTNSLFATMDKRIQFGDKEFTEQSELVFPAEWWLVWFYKNIFRLNTFEWE